MKILSNTLTRIAALITLILISLQNSGQGVEVTIKKDNSDWYTQPWVWVVGGAVFILLLVALLRRGGGKKD